MRMVCAIVFIAILGVEPRAAESTGTAAVTVNVPVGATLFINGQPTHQMTAVRHFITPELAAGKRYRYNLEATYTWDGEEVTKKTSIVVSAGAKLNVDLTKAETVVKPPPPPEPEVKPEPKPEPKPIAKPMPEPKKPELPPVPPPVPNPTEPKPDPPRPQPQPSAPKPPVPKPTEPKPEPSRPLAPPPREHQGKKGK